MSQCGRLLAVVAAASCLLASGCSSQLLTGARPPSRELSDEGEVRRLIDSLVDVKSFDVGLSVVSNAMDFPPVRRQWKFDGGASGLGNFPHERNEALTRLVALGPHALPALLEHLDDKRSTQLVVKWGSMWHEHEVPVRQEDEEEKKALTDAGIQQDAPIEDCQEADDPYVVTVGDICFVVVGMITNRAYNAVRYQPSMCVVVNSPTSTPAIAKAVRGIWKDKKVPDALFGRLVADYEGNGEYSLSAATRLLYYFPERSIGMIRDKLNTLLGLPDREHCGLEPFLNAVAWVPEPAIRKSIQNFLLETHTASLIENGAAAFSDAKDPANFDHLVRLADEMKRNPDPESVNASRELLYVNLTTFPERSHEAVRSFLAQAPPQAVVSCCYVCYLVDAPPIEELAPLLADTSKGIGRYLILGEDVLEWPNDDDHLSYRICDHAYEVIVRAMGDREARCTGTREEMDARIAALVARLRKDPTRWPFTADEIAARRKDQDKFRLALEARRERAARAGFPPQENWFLAATDPTCAREELEAAVCSLLSAKEGKEPYTRIDSILRAPPFEGLAYRDALDRGQRAAVGTAIEGRLIRLLSGEASDNPRLETLKTACLLALWDPKTGVKPLGDLIERIIPYLDQEATRVRAAIARSDNDLEIRFCAHSDKYRSILALFRVLIRNGFPGAATAFRSGCAEPRRYLFMDTGVEKALLGILIEHWKVPEVDAVLKAVFLDSKSPWNLSNASYRIVNSCGETTMLEVPVFRCAMRQALSDETIRGELYTSSSTYGYRIRWKKGFDPGFGTSPDAPVDEEGMPLRQCDLVLEWMCNGVFHENQGPEFKLDWPLNDREKARLEWLSYLDDSALGGDAR